MNDVLYNISYYIIDIIDIKYIYIIPVLILLYIFYYQLKVKKFELISVFNLFVLVPALTPLITILYGYEYFTAMNHELQDSNDLVVSSILLISIFSISSILGSKIYNNNVKSYYGCISYGNDFVFIIMSINIYLLINFLESGSILNMGYGVIKQNQSAYSSLVNQLFNLSISVIIASITSIKRKKIIQISLIVFIIISLIYSRRTMTIGLSLILLYTFDTNLFKPKNIVIFSIILISLWFVGKVRSVGLIPYLYGVRYEYTDPGYYSMPGGGANIFIGMMGVLDLLHSDALSFPETMPILLWPRGEYEFTIYPKYGYAYNGGMHIATMLYWNFGLVGTSIGGFILGYITKAAGSSLIELRKLSCGGLGRMLSIAYVLVLPNTLWYSPIAIIKLSLAIIFVYYISVSINIFSQKRRIGKNYF